MLMSQQMRGMTVQPASRFWTPYQLANRPFLWVNDDSSQAGGASFTTWGDVSGNARNLTEGSSGPNIVYSSQNGRRVADFNAAGTKYISQTSSADIFRNVSAGWAFFVYARKVLDGAAQTRILLYSTKNLTGNSRFGCLSNFSVNNAPTLLVRRQDADSTAILSGTGFTDTNFHMVLFEMDWANGDGRIYVDGALDVSNLSLTSSGNTENTAATDAFVLGRNMASIIQYANDLVGELVVSNASILGTTERDKLFGYAAHRWGLLGNLPGGHPYKTIPPTI